MKKIKVRSTSGRYEIWCGRGVAAQSARAVGRLAETECAVPDFVAARMETPGALAIERIFKGFIARTILFDDSGRPRKNLSTVEKACRQLVRAGADRRALLVAVGGGVVGDVAGFVAASYARGIGLVHIPTTLVAQVDSAVGGKNRRESSGREKPCRCVLSCETGDCRSRALAHASATGVSLWYLRNSSSTGGSVTQNCFSFLELKVEKLVRRDPAALDFVIERSVSQKARVVSLDERESGLA